MKITKLPLGGLTALLVCHHALAARAAEISPLQTPDITLPSPPSPLDKEAALMKLVSFEAKQQPLGDLLGELQKQSGVELSAAAELGPQLRVTARVNKLPLASVMSALSRLYLADWMGDKGKYVLQPRTLSATDRQLAQLGELHWFRFRDNNLRSPDNKIHRGNALAQQIAGQVSPAALRSEKGVALWDLDGETQTAVRRYFAEISGKPVLTTDLLARTVQKQDLELRVEIPPVSKASLLEQIKNAPTPPPGVFKPFPTVIPSATLFNEAGELVTEIPLSDHPVRLSTPEDAPEKPADNAAPAAPAAP